MVDEADAGTAEEPVEAAAASGDAVAGALSDSDNSATLLESPPGAVESVAEPSVVQASPCETAADPRPLEGLVLSQPPSSLAVGFGAQHLSSGHLHDPQSGAEDLISRELLNELSHEPDTWHEDCLAHTPPAAGFETPSGPRTPSPRESPHQSYAYVPLNHEGLMCIDQWDWKTDAPEFVPGNLGGPLVPQTDTSAWAVPPGGGGRDGVDLSRSGAGTTDSARLSQLRAQYEWQLQTKSDDMRDLQNRLNTLEVETAQVRASWEIERRNLVRQIGHYRAVLERYCIPVEEAGSATFAGMADEGQQQYFQGVEPSAPSQWSSGNVSGTKSAAGGVDESSGALAAGTGSAAPEGSGETQASSLDSKMRQLNSLLQEGQAATQKRRTTPDGAGDTERGSGNAREGGGTGSGTSAVAEAAYSSGSIASTLRAMFPHATIRTRSAVAGAESEDVPEGSTEQLKASELSEAQSFQDHVQRLERSTGGTIDERAMRALQGLSAKDAREALQKVDELVYAQGGHCRNLSSILQSVCRKIEKRSGKSARDEDSRREGLTEGKAGGAVATAPSGEGEHLRASRRARRLDEDGDAFDSSGSNADAAVKVGARPRGALNGRAHGGPRGADVARQNALRTEQRDKEIGSHDDGDEPLGRTVSQISQVSQATADTPTMSPGAASRRSTKSWADIDDIEDDEFNEVGGPSHETQRQPLGDEGDYWTTQRIEKAARRGFELRRRGDHWELKISMSGLEPRLTEAGMQRYCDWLRTRLGAFREDHGDGPLRSCRGEVDFSHNDMSNQMVWMLLETLAQHEVHTALLKLFANNISQGGILALCEFIRMNERAEALHELHLSHNKIDDESALELLRTLNSQRPRYPPRRTTEASGPSVAPVWLRLNHNRIRDPDAVRRAAEVEEITICSAWDRNACGTSKCCKRECPLVHLYSFSVQARAWPPPVRHPAPQEQERPAASESRAARRKRLRRGQGSLPEHRGAEEAEAAMEADTKAQASLGASALPSTTAEVVPAPSAAAPQEGREESSATLPPDA
mmetsp:Transcript_14448/g.31673  ORF Transcript_14448/g.31673 Transcript_14448/m.31673 type:complete len:1036 (-) Transcript_14448:79-3186(-)